MSFGRLRMSHLRNLDVSFGGIRISRMAEFGYLVWRKLGISFGGIWMSRLEESTSLSGGHFQQVSQETLESLLQHGGRVSQKGIGF